VLLARMSVSGKGGFAPTGQQGCALRGG
jgi:hypothetical protein